MNLSPGFIIASGRLQSFIRPRSHFWRPLRRSLYYKCNALRDIVRRAAPGLRGSGPLLSVPASCREKMPAMIAPLR
ncbi:hypothetical protein DSL62_13770 [Pantoea sp. 3_1284]|nr:hypothetical protein DSL62_13770 [Pantoea sp. 3_1284]